MSSSIFSCPVCRGTMERDGRIYRCGAGHSFDIAKEGYVNLLPANQRHSEMPGDDRDMVSARTRFLDGGWYAPLRRTLCEAVGALMPEHAVLIDAGCGEGYYTEALCDTVARKQGAIAGVDLSKAAVKRAAKRCRTAEIAVASVYHLPLADCSADLLVDCFAPLAQEEYRRILKPGTAFLYVVPGRRHLWEMKELLYDRPYENDVREERYPGFRQADEIPLSFGFHLSHQEDIAALFRMTPYAWKTPKAGIERLMAYKDLDISAEFRILVFRREES